MKAGAHAGEHWRYCSTCGSPLFSWEGRGSPDAIDDVHGLVTWSPAYRTINIYLSVEAPRPAFVLTSRAAREFAAALVHAATHAEMP